MTTVAAVRFHKLSGRPHAGLPAASHPAVTRSESGTLRQRLVAVSATGAVVAAAFQPLQRMDKALFTLGNVGGPAALALPHYENRVEVAVDVTEGVQPQEVQPRTAGRRVRIRQPGGLASGEGERRYRYAWDTGRCYVKKAPGKLAVHVVEVGGHDPDADRRILQKASLAHGGHRYEDAGGRDDPEVRRLLRDVDDVRMDMEQCRKEIAQLFRPRFGRRR